MGLTPDGVMTDRLAAPGLRSRTMAARVHRRLYRAPIPLYRAGLGWIIGPRFVLVQHRGRSTGLDRYVVLEVAGRDPGRLVVVSGFGSKSDWFRNMEVSPSVRIWTATLRGVPALARILPPHAARTELERYRRDHAHAAKLLARMFDLPAFESGTEPLPDDVVAKLPVVEITFGVHRAGVLRRAIARWPRRARLESAGASSVRAPRSAPSGRS